ncbi:hypothetical protein BHE74_00017600 [Ensete ventricosum]|nr:hypothetical protein BHE74_00017600 [Ensete ventricosum]
MAKPAAAKAPCKRAVARREQLTGAAAARGHSSLQRGARRGSDVGRKDDRPLARRLPVGKGSRHLRRGNSDNSDTVRVKEG